MSNSLREQQLDALKNADLYIDNLVEGMMQCVKCLSDSNLKEGYELIVTITEGLQWVYEVVELTKPILTEAIEEIELNERLNELVEALENEDLMLISDLYEYEIIPLLKGWQGIIKNSLL